MTTIPNPPSLGDEFTNDVTGVTYQYDGSKWVIIKTPGSEEAEQLGEDLAALTSRVSDGETIQEQIQSTVSDALDTQGNIVDNVNILTTKVEALEGTVIDGKWYAESRPTPRTGGFDITKGGVQSMSNWDADFIRIHKTDNSGKVFTFAEIVVGDYIRVGAPGSTAVYKITSVPTGSLDLQSFGVEPVSSTGQPVPELVYDFEFLPSFDPSAFATIDYVDDLDDLNFKKTGDTITGTVKIFPEKAPRALELKAGADAAGTPYNIFTVSNSSGGLIFYIDERGAIASTNDYTPRSGGHLANKKYVDDAIAALKRELSL